MDSTIRKRLALLPEQLINAGIVAGIVAISTLGDWPTVAKAFGLTFLIEMRKYRKL